MSHWIMESLTDLEISRSNWAILATPKSLQHSPEFFRYCATATKEVVSEEDNKNRIIMIQYRQARSD